MKETPAIWIDGAINQLAGAGHLEVSAFRALLAVLRLRLITNLLLLDFLALVAPDKIGADPAAVGNMRFMLWIENI